MIVPLMIWSARIVMHSQACSDRDEHPCEDGRQHPQQDCRRGAEDVAGRLRDGLRDEARDQECHEGRGEHHAFDADVHDARALVHDPAHRAQGDRGRQGDDDRGDVGHDLDEVADQPGRRCR